MIPWYSCQQSLLQYFYEACQDLAGFKDSSFSCFKRQNVAHDWIFASSTLEAWDAWKTCQVLTSMDILKLPLEQLLQGEGSREFSRDLRMLMLNGDFWHMMTQDSPEYVKSLWRTLCFFPFCRLWLSLHAGFLLGCHTDTNVRGLREHGLKGPHFLKSRQPLEKSVWHGLSEGYHMEKGWWSVMGGPGRVL